MLGRHLGVRSTAERGGEQHRLAVGRLTGNVDVQFGRHVRWAILPRRKRPKKTEYRVTFAGDHASRLNASTSDSKTVEEKVGVTLKVSSTTVKLGRKVTISGAVSPAHTGSVQLTIKRGKKVLVNQKSVPLNSSSLYKTPFKPTGTGSYTVIVSFAGDDDHLGNTATKKFKVTR